MYFSEVESKRFGFNVFRDKQINLDYDLITESIIENNVDILFLRIPSSKQSTLFKLNQKGLPFLVADNLVYYELNLTKAEIKPVKNVEIEYIVADKNHESILDKLVIEIFNGYTNHYFSNPYLDKKAILEGYQEWARNNITVNNNSTVTFLIKRGNEFIGFACCGFNKDAYESEGILYGVVNSESGKGLYADLIRYTQAYFKNLGFKTMKVSTQTQNLAVQRVWVKEGFVLTETLATVHINAFLKTSKVPVIKKDIIITEEETEKYGALTGDLNPVHFDNDFAVSKGFKQKIAHGIGINSILTKLYGIEYPGFGTLFLNYSYHFLKPIYINQRYSVEISFPVVNTNGFHLSLVKVFDSENKLCLLSYNNLLKK